MTTEFPSDSVSTTEEKPLFGMEAFLFGVFLTAAVGFIAFMIASILWGDPHFGRHIDTGRDGHEQTLTMSNGGTIHQQGYEILIGQITNRDGLGWKYEQRGYAAAFVTKAPSDKPFELTCLLLDRKGHLVGGGGAMNLKRQQGALLPFDLVTVQPVNVRCLVKP